MSERVSYLSKVLLKLRPLNLLERSRTNHYLDDAERHELDELLSEGETELDQFQEMIVDLQKQLDALREERDALEQHLSCAKSLTSPIRKMPPEILTQIFIDHGVSNELHDRSDLSSFPGLNLSFVSSHWRNIAFSTPALWTSYSLKTLHNAMDGTSFDPCNQLSLLRHMLLPLSSDAPLHVKIIVHDPEEDDPIHPGLPFLCRQAHRWKTVEIQDLLSASRCSYWCALLDTLGSIEEGLDSLVLFRLEGNSSRTLETFGHWHYGAFLETAINLRTLHLQSGFIFASGDMYPWSRITHFVTEYPINSELIKALCHLSMLESLHVRFISWDDAYRPDSLIVLERLNKLHIETSYLLTERDTRKIDRLLSVITTPSLTSLTIGHNRPGLRDREQQWAAKELVTLLERSQPKLVYLDLSISLPVDILRRLLASLPTITTLIILALPPLVPTMLTDDLLSLGHDEGVLLPNLTWLKIITKLEQQRLLIDMLESRSDVQQTAVVQFERLQESYKQRWKDGDDELREFGESGYESQ